MEQYLIGNNIIIERDAKEIAFLFELEKRNIDPTAENLVDKIYRNPRVYDVVFYPRDLSRKEHIKIVEERLEYLSKKGILSTKETDRIFKRKVFFPTKETVETLKLDDYGFRNWLMLSNEYKEKITPESAKNMRFTIELIS